jgi:TRAP-type mannitol/chloroaromatic compound transport system substrate-binding protein
MKRGIATSLSTLVVILLFLALIPASTPPVRLAPDAALAQPAKIVWKIQTTWPSGITLFQQARDIGARVKEMTGGRFEWEVLPVGAVVGAFEVLEAVQKGLVDGAHGWPGYWAGKNTAAALFGGTLGGPFGMRLEDTIAWLYAGGGEDLYNELLQKDLKVDNVMAILHPACCQEPLGWFKKPIRSLADFRGMKMRSSGLGVDMLRELGVSAVVLAGGEILPALERGVVDGVEWSNPASDIPLGFHQVAKYLIGPSARQPFGVQEMLISRKKWAELPADLKAIVRTAVLAEVAMATAREFAASGKVFAELESKYKVQVVTLPPEVVEAEIKAIAKVLDDHAKKNPSFARVLNHQKEFAAKVSVYHNWVRPPHSKLVEHYFGKK